MSVSHKRKAETAPEEAAAVEKKVKCGRVLCKTDDCWEDAIAEEDMCQKHTNEEAAKTRKAVLCQERNCQKKWQGTTTKGQNLCYDHFIEFRNAEAKKVYCVECKSTQVDELTALCLYCKTKKEHTPDGWTREDLLDHWKCVQHNCCEFKQCGWSKKRGCYRSAKQLIDGKFFCVKHVAHYKHDQICGGKADNHKGCRGSVPLECNNCGNAVGVKFLENTRSWLCKKCYKYKRCLFTQDGEPEECCRDNCHREATLVTADYWPRCDLHPYIE